MHVCVHIQACMCVFVCVCMQGANCDEDEINDPIE